MRKDDFDLAMTFYRDRFGFPAGRAGAHEPSGNCLMFLGEEMLVQCDLGLDEGDVGRFWGLLNLCALEPGNFRRTPFGSAFALDQEGWDDFVGITAAAAVMSGRIRSSLPDQVVTSVILFGRRHYHKWGPFHFPYCYVTGNPAPSAIQNWRAWFGRYPQFVAHLRWCAGERPNWFQRLAWCWSVAFAGWKDPRGQDPWRLTYLMVRAQKMKRRRPSLESLAEWIWRKRFLKHWPGGIRQVRARYFGGAEKPDDKHPLAFFAGMDF